VGGSGALRRENWVGWAAVQGASGGAFPLLWLSAVTRVPLAPPAPLARRRCRSTHANAHTL